MTSVPDAVRAVATPPEPRAGDGDRTARADRTVALPVELDLRGRHAEAVRSWVEGTLGWQAVSEEMAGLVPAAVVLRDLGSVPGAPPSSGGSSGRSADSSGGMPGGVPSVLLVDDEAAPGLAGRLAAALAPDAVVAWPSGREQLVDVVAEVLDRPRRRTHPGITLRIGGSAGGVGTTTVTLAVAGLAAWRGTPSLAAVRGTGLVPRVVPTAALAGLGVWAGAEPLAGVPGARAVRLADRDPVPDPSDPRIGMLLVDAGVDPEVDVLVCRPDAAALQLLAVTTAAAVVLVGEGPATARDLRRAAAGRPGIVLPWSARVARAGLAGRVPAGLPGAWLRRLVPLLPLEVSPPNERRAGSP